MAPYQEQIGRIKEKLRKARKADKHYEVFGASSHQYKLNAPVKEEEVTAFEAKHGFTLPACYRAFILGVGHGGNSYSNSGAGPYYGIYPLGEDIDALVEPVYLKNDCLIYPGMTTEYWDSLVASLNAERDEEISDEEYYAEMGRVFGGIMPIGSQGCSFLHGIVLNGPYTGRVVNLSADRDQPLFTFEDNFLDWYERWLNEVMTGQLLTPAAWFGYHMGGADTKLIRQFLDTDGMQEKKNCLNGLQHKKIITASTVELVEREYFNPAAAAFQDQLLLILTKHAYERARPLLIKLAPVQIGSVCQLVYYYAKEHLADWLPFVRQYLHTVQDKDEFRFCTYIVTAEHGDVLAPFIESNDVEIRETVIYTLSKFVLERQHYLDTFIKGLYDVEDRVVVAALHALSDVNDTRLLPHYKKVAERYADKKTPVLSALDARLDAYGLTHATIRDWEPRSATVLQSLFSRLRGKKN